MGVGPKSVGLKLPNPYGLHGMAGNVSEWVYDHWWRDWHEEKPAVDPVNNTPFIMFGQEAYFIRGGSFKLLDDYLHLYRSSADLGNEGRASTGFRCAASLEINAEGMDNE